MQKVKFEVGLNESYMGKIDALVEQGVYTDRGAFINDAVNRQLSLYPDYSAGSEKQGPKNKSTDFFASMGIFSFTRKDLESYKTAGVRINVKLIGMLIISRDVTPELAVEVFGSIKTYGIISASKGVWSKLIKDNVIK